MLTTARIVFVSCVLWLGGCVSSDANASAVTGPQVLALVAEPPDAVPGAAVTYQVLAVDQQGILTPDDLTVSYCQTATSVGDNRLASDACALTVEGTELTPPDAEAETDSGMASSGSLTGRVPSDACTRFGPSVPATTRAPDPDPSGGYYQPLRIAFSAGTGLVQAVGTQRLRCPLAKAPFNLTRQFREQYVPNQNPKLTELSITLRTDGTPVSPDAVPRAADLALRAAWTPDSRESYLVYSSFDGALLTQTEALRMSWYVTQGELTFPHTARESSESDNYVDNAWRSPRTSGVVHLWLVLRDDRGGSAYASYDLTVQ